MSHLRPVRNVPVRALCVNRRVAGVVLALTLAHSGVSVAAPCESGGDEAGLGNDVIANALDLGVVSPGAPRQVAGEIGNTTDCDIVPIWTGDFDADVYHFTLEEASDVSLRADAMSNLDCGCTPQTSGIVSLFLYNESGVLWTQNDSAGASDPVLDLWMPAGEYYVMVAAAGQTSVPDPGGITSDPTCSVESAPEVDGGDTDPTGCYELNVVVTQVAPMGGTGAPPAWEGSMRVSTYSTVNLLNGNMLTELLP